MGDTPPPQTSSTTHLSPPSEMEAKHYYRGLPSKPRLVARTSTTPWELPAGPDAQERELRPVGNHPIMEVWENSKLAPEIQALLHSMKVQWTSIDLLRIGVEHPRPVILWLGVTPGSLSGHEGVIVASKCRQILEKYNIDDVDVEIRQSIRW